MIYYSYLNYVSNYTALQTLLKDLKEPKANKALALNHVPPLSLYKEGIDK